MEHQNSFQADSAYKRTQDDKKLLRLPQELTTIQTSGLLDSVRRTASQRNSPLQRKFNHKARPPGTLMQRDPKSRTMQDLRSASSLSFQPSRREELYKPYYRPQGQFRSNTPLLGKSETPDLKGKSFETQSEHNLLAAEAQRKDLRFFKNLKSSKMTTPEKSSSFLQSTLKLSRGIAESVNLPRSERDIPVDFQSASTLDLTHHREPEKKGATYFIQKRRVGHPSASMASPGAAQSIQEQQRSITPNQVSSHIRKNKYYDVKQNAKIRQQYLAQPRPAGTRYNEISSSSSLFGSITNSARANASQPVVHVKQATATTRYRNQLGVQKSTPTNQYQSPSVQNSHSYQQHSLLLEQRPQSTLPQHSPLGSSSLNHSLLQFQSQRSTSSLSHTPRTTRNAAHQKQELIYQEEKESSTAERKRQESKIKSEVRQKVKQKPRVTEPLVDKMKDLPPEAVGCILQFCMDQYKELMQVSGAWRLALNESVDTLCRELETGFINTYAQVLLFKQSWATSSTMSFSGEKGLRVDRVIKCEPFDTVLNKSIKIAFTYKFFGEEDYYRAEYRFDIVKKGPRVVWIHKDNNQYHGDPLGRSYSPVVPLICVGDNLEFAINIYSMRGFMDVTSITWEPPRVSHRPDENALNYVKEKISFFSGRKAPPPVQNGIKKIFADLTRICEIEDEEVEWYDRDYYVHKERALDLSFLKDNFYIKREMYSGVDLTVGKIQLVASQPGKIMNPNLGCSVIVKGGRDELSNQSKRLGLMIDRHCPIQLRVGDILIFYISIGRNIRAKNASPTKTQQPKTQQGGVNQVSMSKTFMNSALQKSSSLPMDQSLPLHFKDQGMLRQQLKTSTQTALLKGTSPRAQIGVGYPRTVSTQEVGKGGGGGRNPKPL